MKEYWKEDYLCIEKEKVIPKRICNQMAINNANELLQMKPACISFQEEQVATFKGKHAFVVLDFGKEVCGSIRVITRSTSNGTAKIRITLGESLSECYTSIGEKNATNDHSPRDFKCQLAFMSDLTFGLSGFRFARIELLEEQEVAIRNIFAINTLPCFEKEGYIKTSDEELNQIIDTAIYTLKLCFQNGYIWDGIKRDRLVWSGDLNQEIINSLYLFGDNSYITNSLDFLRSETTEGVWMNMIPSYSAWWVINLCDYYSLTGNKGYFDKNREYLLEIMKHFNDCISEDGNMDFQQSSEYISFFLDWPTCGTDDAVIGTAAIIILAAKKYLAIEKNIVCEEIVRKLEKYLNQPCKYKQTRAFQILAGRNVENEAEFLEHNGAEGYSTFMSYYLLKADTMAQGTNMLAILKEYFGAMLSRGATTFWEDFDMSWLEGSGRIDELPKENQKDIHGDFGAFCYKGFRHSLCHGWASGIVAFIIEHMIGLHVINNGEAYELKPYAMGVQEIEAKLPIKTRWLTVKIVDGKIEYEECG